MKQVKSLRNSQDYPQSPAPAIGKIDTYATIPAAQTAAHSIVGELTAAVLIVSVLSVVPLRSAAPAPNRVSGLGSLEATLPREMVSRRKILSRSRDDLNLDQSYITQEEEEDVWYQKEKLYKAICLWHDPATVVDEKLAVQWRVYRCCFAKGT
uniref:Uncharacterized protein n=1 Tax=Anopheles melas TaxID=34690 RepID=A0A182TSE2_9DIPT